MEALVKPKSADSPSLLQRLMELLEQDPRFHVSFEDLTGICADVADLSLPAGRHSHTCSFCRFAKFANGNRAYHDCRLNKRACNRRAIGTRTAWAGACHLGLTEVVQPVAVGGLVVGVLYYGSVVVKRTLGEARRRIRRYCKRHGFDPEPYLKELAELPLVTEHEVELMQGRAAVAADLMARLIEASSVPLTRYAQGSAQWLVEERRNTPPIVRAAMRYVREHFDEPITVTQLAQRFHCHPDYLTRVFKTTHHQSLRQFITHTRVERAKRLLLATEMGIGEIAYRTGFQTHSHFTRVFRETSGLSPGEYRQKSRA